MFLNQIVARKKEDVRSKKNKKYLTELKSKILRWQEVPVGGSPRHSFQEALSKRDQFPSETPLHLIAEIKKASPSKGIIREEFDPVEIAGIYEKGGATAISVLTEEHFFKGSLNHLEEVRNKVGLPLLRKDFLIDEIELIEAKAFGASAILLIAALLERNQMVEYYLQAKEIGLDVLTEVHSEKELEAIVEWAPVIGINNRDLTTFDVDIGVTLRLLKYVPIDRIIVSESGLSKKEDLLPLIERGVQAVLIGESFMKEPDIAVPLSNLFPKKRPENEGHDQD